MTGTTQFERDWSDDLTSADPNSESQFSLVDLAIVLLRKWKWIALASLVGFVWALIPVLTKQYSYKATASFAPQNAEGSRAGISAFAGALGIAVPTGNLSQSPQFYAELLTSRVVLAPILRDTFTVVEQNGARKTIAELFEIRGLSRDQMTELTIGVLASSIRSEVSNTTGTVRLAVATPWRSVSLALAGRLLQEVNAFNLGTRQSQAGEERRFVEERLAVARLELRVSEDRMESYLRGNRMINSPELELSRDRLQREVGLNQQVVTSLSQALEEARIREVRDTRVITVIEPPAALTSPESRGRVRRGIMGLLFGGLVGAGLVFLLDLFCRRVAAGDPNMLKLKAALDDAGGFARFRRRTRQSES